MTDLTDVISAHWLRNSITDDMEHDDNDWSTFCQCGHRIADTTATDIEALHRAHVAAALRESRAVRTFEELDALPEGTVIHAGGFTYERVEHCYTPDGTLTRVWACAGWPGREPSDDWDADEPARVLYRPDEDGDLS